MNRAIDRELIESGFAAATVYQAEIGALLDDLRALAPDLELLTDTHQHGAGFSTPESRAAVDRMTVVERTERRAQPIRRDDTGRPIIGLKWLNRTTIAAGTGEISAPGNFRGIATAADAAFALTEHVHRIRRVLLASGYPDPEPDRLSGAPTAIAAAARPAGFIGPMPAVTTIVAADQQPDVADLAARLQVLVTAAPSASLLAPIERDLTQLVDQVSTVVDGPDRSHRPDPCPHCGNHSLIRYEATRRRPEPITRCERDPRWKSKHFRPCVCSSAICQCKTDPVAYRHEWFDNPKDKTQTSVWDLIDRINRIKENALLETKAQDAAQRVRDLHTRVEIQPWAQDCPGDELVPVDQHEATETGADDDQVEQQLIVHQHEDTEAGAVCVTCPPAGVICGHCSRPDDPDWTPYPCPTITALDGN